MSWQSVFFSSNGRMGQKDFWVAALILFCSWVVSMFLHALAFPVWLVLAYCWICIYSKRLHDGGRSGWLNLIPFVIGCAATVISMVIAGAAAIMAIMTGDHVNAGASSWMVFWGSLSIVAGLWGFAGLVNLIFLLWVGLGPSDAGDNRYGPPPPPWLRSAAPPPAAA